MTTSTPTTIVCPQCGATDGTALSSGLRLCFDCRHEWNPADVPPPRPLAVVPDVPAVDDVLGPPDTVTAEREAQARLDALIGTEVILDGGQRAVIVEFPDDNHVTVVPTYDDGGGEPFTVDFNDVVRSVEPVAPVVDVPDDEARALASTVGTVAALTLRAGVSMVTGTGDDVRIGMPPTGWLPDDPGTVAIIEQGVAYAVAILIHAYGIPADQASAFADDLMTEVQTETTKGE